MLRLLPEIVRRNIVAGAPRGGAAVIGWAKEFNHYRHSQYLKLSMSTCANFLPLYCNRRPISDWCASACGPAAQIRWDWRRWTT